MTSKGRMQSRLRQTGFFVKTVDFISAHKGEPFCYMVGFPDPHGPDTVRPPYDTMFKDQKYKTPRTFDPGTRRVPNWGKGDAGFNGMALYYGMVKCIDDNVGKILGALRKNGVIENTIVVFTSDHGDLRGEHHRQNKGAPFEGSAKIPFVIYYPGRITHSLRVLWQHMSLKDGRSA